MLLLCLPVDAFLRHLSIHLFSVSPDGSWLKSDIPEKQPLEPLEPLEPPRALKS